MKDYPEGKQDGFAEHGLDSRANSDEGGERGRNELDRYATFDWRAEVEREMVTSNKDGPKLLNLLSLSLSLSQPLSVASVSHSTQE